MDTETDHHKAVASIVISKRVTGGSVLRVAWLPHYTEPWS